VYVNGVKAGQICWAPHELEVGHLLVKGDNEISVKVVGSLKNTFGHFYKNWTSLLNGPHDWNAAPGEVHVAGHVDLAGPLDHERRARGELDAGEEVVETLAGNGREEELVKTMFIDKRSIMRRKTDTNRDIGYSSLEVGF